MKKYIRLSAVLALLGALIVGVLGNALWDLLFKPVLVWISTVLLNIATLGLNSLRDNLYIEIAKGLYDRSGFETFSFMMVGLLTLLLFLVLLMPIAFLLLTNEMMRKKNLVKAGPNKRQSVVSLRRLFRWLRWSLVVLAASGTLNASLVLTILARMAFITNGAVYLDQSQRIIAPYLTDNERIVLRSRVAQMKSRSDFDRVNADLTKVATANNVALPAFAPF